MTMDADQVEIEVTPEMVAAGVAAMDQWFHYSEARAVVSAVYRAMSRQAVQPATDYWITDFWPDGTKFLYNSYSE